MRSVLRVVEITVIFLFLKLVSGEKIEAECVFRSGRVGLEEGLPFSTLTQVTSEVERGMRFYGYQECNAKDGTMESFQVVVADASAQNRIPLPKVGPNSNS